MVTSEGDILRAVERWFEQVVLGLNLCPFAHKPQHEGRIRFELSMADSVESALSDLYRHLLNLERQPEIETTVMICGNLLDDFADYNQFLDLADQLLAQQDWEGLFQIASFHPDYRFAGSAEDDRANWTNRSPYPLLHLIREESITQAVASHPDVNSIPPTNIQRLEQLSEAEMAALFSGRRVTCISSDTKKPG